MARWLVVALGLAAASAGLDDGVSLREGDPPATRALIEMKAQGESRPELPPGSPEGAVPPPPIPLKIEARLDVFERVIARKPDGSPRRAARRVVEAASAIGGPGASLFSIRPEVALLIADRRDLGTVVFSPGGPLTRWELEMVQVPGDPLALGGLLPSKPVKLGDKWPVSAESARNLTDYDALTSNGLEAKLESLDDARAVVRIGGEVRGSTRGGVGLMGFSGKLVFDRKSKLIQTLELDRDETRAQGLVEFGLAVKSRLTVERSAVPVPSTLSDDAVTTLPKDDDPSLERLLLSPSGAPYSLEHDRDWHLTREDARQAVLRRVEKGEMLAQCNLSVGPDAGKGRHQDVSAFRDDVKKALGPRFGQVIGAGEVDDADEANYLYKVGVVGREGDVHVLWYYYLAASPAGKQILATFTLDQEMEPRFGDEDRRILKGLRWKAPGPTK